jgi:hypothetical protein
MQRTSAESHPEYVRNIATDIVNTEDDAELGHNEKNHDEAAPPPATRVVHGYKVRQVIYMYKSYRQGTMN